MIKTLEKVVAKQLIDVLEDYTIFDRFQSGFRFNQLISILLIWHLFLKMV